MLFAKKKLTMVSPGEALPGRERALDIEPSHYVLKTMLKGPYPEGAEIVYLGLGCFWGAERRFWQLEGIYVTAVGYGAGFTNNPTYEEVCTGQTGHNELVMVVYEPSKITLLEILKVFFEAHDPTQGMRQGNDMGTQYRSGIYVTTEEQLTITREAKRDYGAKLTARGFGPVTTEVLINAPFYYAETYHQQYLAKNPNGYCGLKGTDVAFS